MPTALVTGASSGIGREIARRLADDGHHLVVVARREAALRSLADEIGDAEVIAADLAGRAGRDRLAGAVPAVDVLVNNAGFGDFGPFARADRDRTMAMLELNVAALTDLTHRYLPGMLERGRGRVLNVASTAAFLPGPLMAVYYATKAYVLSFTEALAEELRGTGVTATALCPGPTATGFQQAADMEMSRLVAGRNLPSAEEVAAYGVRAMERGDVIAVPGALNKVLAASVRAAPRPVLRRMVRAMQSTKED
ncbi:MAG: SDR family oxidoreductase [Actinobacteria bacterium]|nr:SDR family oxidoreductase [Actinomycetota bacterium]